MSADLDDADNLEKFFGVLLEFNKNSPLRKDMKEKMIKFFDYKWNNDRN